MNHKMQKVSFTPAVLHERNSTFITDVLAYAIPLCAAVRIYLKNAEAREKQTEHFARFEGTHFLLINYIKELTEHLDRHRALFGHPENASDQQLASADKIASCTLDLVCRWRTLAGYNVLPKRQLFYSPAMEPLKRLLKKTSPELKPPLDRPRSKRTVAIVASLPHEFQSVLRRLDHITKLSPSHHLGFNILKRYSDCEDPAPKLDYRIPVPPGFAVGYYGDLGVIVICAGLAGQEEAANAISELNQNLAEILESEKMETPALWAVVGVCAYTRPVPFGSVFVSKDVLVAKVAKGQKDPTAKDWKIDRHDHHGRKLLSPNRHAAKLMFRVAPQEDNVVSPQDVHVVPDATFVCVPHVLAWDTSRDALLEAVRSYANGELAVAGAAIEMEGAAPTTAFGVQTVVIKAVVDYAGLDKTLMDKALKNRIHLYAAETAADVALAVLSTTPTRTKRNRRSDRAVPPPT